MTRSTRAGIIAASVLSAYAIWRNRSKIQTFIESKEVSKNIRNSVNRVVRLVQDKREKAHLSRAA